jgi:hypothetical protein
MDPKQETDGEAQEVQISITKIIISRSFIGNAIKPELHSYTS